jgi:hypothetical protein
MKTNPAKKGPAGLFGRATGQSGWPVWCLSGKSLEGIPSKIFCSGNSGSFGSLRYACADSRPRRSLFVATFRGNHSLGSIFVRVASIILKM